MKENNDLADDDYDSPWKDILDAYFAEFTAFFFPTAHADIDWSRGYENLDTELQQVVRDAELGKRLADKLFKVWRADGNEQMVLVHVEVQGQRDTKFAERMYVYNYRVFDRYRQPVVSLAVLGDDSKSWHPNSYRRELWGCCASLSFPTAKLLDYAKRWEELEADPNPFAVAVMAHLRTRSTKHDPNKRLSWKLRLAKMLYERGYQRQDILELFKFIDWLLTLPQDLEQQFRADFKAYETASMGKPYITSIERMGIEEGLRQGLEGQRQLLVTQATYCFDDETAKKLAPLLKSVSDFSDFAQIGQWLVTKDSAEEFLAQVEQLTSQQ